MHAQLKYICIILNQRRNYLFSISLLHSGNPQGAASPAVCHTEWLISLETVLQWTNEAGFKCLSEEDVMTKKNMYTWLTIRCHIFTPPPPILMLTIGYHDGVAMTTKCSAVCYCGWLLQPMQRPNARPVTLMGSAILTFFSNFQVWSSVELIHKAIVIHTLNCFKTFIRNRLVVVW